MNELENLGYEVLEMIGESLSHINDAEYYVCSNGHTVSFETKQRHPAYADGKCWCDSALSPITPQQYESLNEERVRGSWGHRAGAD